MITPIDDGGPIYPMAGDGFDYTGMSLRDYFASQIMHSLVTASLQEKATIKNSTPEVVYEFCAKNAYAASDAMLKARQA